MTGLYHKRVGKNSGTRKIAVGLACLLGGLICAAPAPLHAAVPALSDKDKRQADDEGKEGAEVAGEIAKQMKLVTDPAVLKRVNDIGQKIAAVANANVVPAEFGNDRVYPFTWHFNVVDSKDVNAFSLPGGYVYVNRGLLDMVRSDDELAGVIGHEITHAAHHHASALAHDASKMNTNTFIALIAALLAHVPADTLTKGFAAGQEYNTAQLNNTYSEQAERDADHGGTILMQKAGYDPVAMLTFMERLQDIERRSPAILLGILRDHPYTDERVGLLRAQLAQMHVPITARDVRAVSGGFRATVSPDNDGARRVVFNSAPLATLADRDGARAQAAAALLNQLLDDGLQLYQVDAKDNVVLVADHPLLIFTPADAALSPGATPAALAAQSAEALRRGLYAQSFVVSQPSL